MVSKKSSRKSFWKDKGVRRILKGIFVRSGFPKNLKTSTENLSCEVSQGKTI